LQFKAKHNFKAYSKAFLFKTGLLPGMPKQHSHVLVLGFSEPLVGQPQNSLVLQLSSIWASSPTIIPLLDFIIMIKFEVLFKYLAWQMYILSLF